MTDEEFKVIEIIGGAHPVAPVEIEPDVILARWSVYEINSEVWGERTRHFVGWNVRYGEGRASTPIVEFDQGKMLGKTRSGRIYQLEGEPGTNSDALYIWGVYCSGVKAFDIVDVTKEYFTEKL